MEAPKFYPEHAWLQQLVGEWVSGPAPGEAEGRPGECPARETARLLGGLWLLLEGQGTMPDDQEFHYQMTLGFDPHLGRFVGCWVGTMSGNYWHYDGELDAERCVLTLHSEGPAMDDPSRRARYRDVLTLHAPGHRSLRGLLQKTDGTWEQFMETHYYRA